MLDDDDAVLVATVSIGHRAACPQAIGTYLLLNEMELLTIRLSQSRPAMKSSPDSFASLYKKEHDIHCHQPNLSAE